MENSSNKFSDDLIGYGEARYIPLYFQTQVFNQGTDDKQTVRVYSSFIAQKPIDIGGGLVAKPRVWAFGQKKETTTSNHITLTVANADGTPLSTQQIEACKRDDVRYYDREEQKLLTSDEWTELLDDKDLDLDISDESYVYPLSASYQA